MPDQPTYRSQVLDHLGLVAGMFDELGIGDVIGPDAMNGNVHWIEVTLRIDQNCEFLRDLTCLEMHKAN